MSAASGSSSSGQGGWKPGKLLKQGSKSIGMVISESTGQGAGWKPGKFIQKALGNTKKRKNKKKNQNSDVLGNTEHNDGEEENDDEDDGVEDADEIVGEVEYDIMMKQEEGIGTIPAVLTQTSHDEILIDFKDTPSHNSGTEENIDRIEIMQYQHSVPQSPEQEIQIMPPVNKEPTKNKSKDNDKCDCINSKMFPHRRKKCMLAKRLPILNQETVISEDEPIPEHDREMVAYFANVSSSDSDTENSNNGKCGCIHSALFPHRRNKCFLRKTVLSNSIPMTGDNNISEISDPAEVIFPSNSDASLPITAEELTTSLLDTSSSSSDSDSPQPQLQRKKKNEKCDCINSSIFPHRRKKCLLNKIGVGKIVSGVKSTVNTLSSMNPRSNNVIDSDDESLAEYSPYSTVFLNSKHLSFGGLILLIALFGMFLSDILGNFFLIFRLLLLFFLSAIVYPYVLGFLFGLIVRPSLLEGIHPSLHLESYLLSCQSISLRCSLTDIEILLENIHWENPRSYMEYNEMTTPKNFLEIGAIRVLIGWEQLIPYVRANCIPALRVKQILLHHVKVHIMKHRSVNSLNVLTAIGQHQEKDGPPPDPQPLASTTSTSGSSKKMFLYYDISLLVIDKLHIYLHKLLDGKTHHLTIPDMIFHRNQLTKKYSATKRAHRTSDRKVPSIYALSIIIGKIIGFQLLQNNSEIVAKIVASGAFNNLITLLKKRRKRLREIKS